MKLINKNISFCLILLLSLIQFSVFASQDEDRKPVIQRAISETPQDEVVKNILVINSYHQGYHWADRLMKGVLDEFHDNEDCDIFIEYMDTKRHTEPGYYQQLLEIYKMKYSLYDFDLILSADDNALTFLLEYRDEIFGEVPVVFCGANQFDATRLIGKKMYTGLEETYDVEATIDLMTTLHDGIDHIVVISDSSTTGNLFRSSIIEAEEKNNYPIKFEYLNNQSLETMRLKLNSLGRNSLVIWTIYLKQPNGIYINSRESVKFVVSNTDVPVYCVWDVVGLGVVGGKITSPYYQGMKASQVAIDILNGANIDEIKIEKSPVAYKFDFEKVREYGIDEELIPKNAIIINDEFSFYRTYKSLIWTVIVIFTFLIGILLVLLHLMRKRKIAELRLMEKNEELGELTDHLEETNKELKFAKHKAEESDNLKTVFLQNISHEIRTPMNGILGFTQVLKIKEMSREDQLKYLDIISTSGNRLMNLINDLISISKAESNQLEFYYSSVNITEVLTTLYDSYKTQIKRKGIEFKFKTDQKLLIFETDRSKLEQILTSLLNNAVKFTESGSIVFGYKQANPDTVEFWVEDTGVGIAEKYQKIIFDSFGQGQNSFYGNDDGCGLGLSIAKAYIEKMGGRIWFRTKLNQGSTFYFELPIKKDLRDEIE